MAAALATGCPRSHRTLCEEQIRARCELAYRCCTDANERFAVLPAELTAYATSEGECFDRLAPVCRAQDGLDDAVELGRMRFDQELASQCIDALAAARDACDAAAFDRALAFEEPCGQASEGAVDNGGTCATSLECGPGGFCDVSQQANGEVNDDTGAIEGECLAPALVGERCGNFGCASGLFCLDDTCTVPPDDGEPCPDFVCAEGNVCNAGGVCEAFPDVGEPCEFQCAEGAFCESSDEKGELGTCRVQRAPGEACDGFFNECANNEACLNGRCTGVVEAVCTGP